MPNIRNLLVMRNKGRKNLSKKHYEHYKNGYYLLYVIISEHTCSQTDKEVSSLFVFQSLDNLGTAEEVRSKRHSTSELGNITYSDVRREGWLHFKQILTEKGKVGTPGLIRK